MNITNYIREDFNSSSIYFSNHFASFQRDELAITSQCYHSFVFQVHDSTQRTVLLHSVNLMSTGRYRCEVSAEAPSFQTVSDHSDMTVIGKDRWRFVIIKNFIFQRLRDKFGDIASLIYSHKDAIMPPRLSLSSILRLSKQMLLLSVDQEKGRKGKKKLCRLKKIVILFMFELKSNCEKEIYHIYHGMRCALERFNSETKIYTCHLKRRDFNSAFKKKKRKKRDFPSRD